MGKTEQKAAFSIRLNDPEAKENYASIYGKGAAGVTRAGNSFLLLRGYTLRELYGIFEKDEVSVLSYILKKTNFDPVYAINKNTLISIIKDAEDFEESCTKKGVNFYLLKEKINTLSAAQCYFLVDEIDRFWNEPLAYGSPAPQLDAFLNDMCNS